MNQFEKRFPGIKESGVFEAIAVQKIPEMRAKTLIIVDNPYPRIDPVFLFSLNPLPRVVQLKRYCLILLQIPLPQF
jgi:hypothetical protein